MVGWLATVLAGHDRGMVYIIIEETKDYVFVADGIGKTMERPKKKNKKHIQIWKAESEELADLRRRLMDKRPVRNEEIKRAIKLVTKSEWRNTNV